MTKNDIYILGSIKKIDAINPLKSVPVSSLCSNINLSHTKIRASIKTLIANELVNEGYMQKNAKTFYITQKGIDLLNSLYADLKNNN